jgi:hypothetical protein
MCQETWIDGKEIADLSAKHSSSHPLVGPQPAFGIPTKVARRVTRDWICTKYDHNNSLVDNGQRAEELLNL